MNESRDPSRSARIDWTGAVLAVLGLGGPVFGLIEWPPLGATHPLVLGSLAIGAVSLVLLVVVERRTANPMVPLELFRSRTFTLANVLTLLLYAALGVVLFLVPMNLIQVQGYTTTAAGASLLPFPIIMFAMSRWSGGLVARVGSRLPLTLGPAIAALGLALYAVPGIGGSYWTTFFPAVIVLALGMSVTVAPLTTTVMSAVEAVHAGVASGVNNAVARVAGLLAIAVFGVVLTQTFDARVRPPLDRLALAAPARAAVERELPKMAGAEVSALPSLSPDQRAVVRRTIGDAFVVGVSTGDARRGGAGAGGCGGRRGDSLTLWDGDSGLGLGPGARSARVSPERCQPPAPVRQFSVQSARVVRSLTNTRLPEMTGCAQVGLSATV